MSASMDTDPRRAVLAVDDDPDVREIIALALVDASVEVIEAEDGARAAEVLAGARGRVGVILLDYFMPGPEPVAVVARLRALAMPGTRIVLVTAAVDACERARELGLDEWIRKPFSLRELRRHVLGR